MTDLYEKSVNMFAHTSVPWQQQIISNFLKKLEPQPNNFCLDVGSGVGNNVATLLNYCERISAIDISARSLNVLRERYEREGGRIEVKKMDAVALEYQSETFDIVVCTEVLEHCLYPEQVLIECVRVLKPGGSLIVSSPNYLNLAGVVKKISERMFPHKPWDAWGTHEEGRENFTTALKLQKWTRATGVHIRSSRGGDIIRSWFPFFRTHYEFIDQHPFLNIGRMWPFKFFMMNYFIIGEKPNLPQ